MNKVSVVIITKNEELKIRDCLESVTWAYEIVVIDDFSNDDTTKICKEYTDKIYRRKLKSMSGQKQFGIEQTTGEWILNIDADERISSGLRDEILTTLEDKEIDGMAFYRPTTFLGQTMKYKGLFEPPLLQMFKKTKGRFADTMVGNPVNFEGKSKTAKNPLIHLYDKDIKKLLNTYNFNTSNAIEDFVKRGVVIRPRNYLWYFFLKPLLVFVRGYIFKQGFKRGFPGFLWYLLRAFFGYFMAYAKLWEHQLNNKNKNS